jgi:hypothetical protein
MCFSPAFEELIGLLTQRVIDRVVLVHETDHQIDLFLGIARPFVDFLKLRFWKIAGRQGGDPFCLPNFAGWFLTKCREGPTHCIAESHCGVRSWKNFSLSKEQGEASGIAGKSGGTAGCKGGRMQGSQRNGDVLVVIISGLLAEIPDHRHRRLLAPAPPAATPPPRQTPRWTLAVLSFDHLVGAQQNRLRHGEAERLALVFVRLYDWWLWLRNPRPEPLEQSI